MWSTTDVVQATGSVHINHFVPLVEGRTTSQSSQGISMRLRGISHVVFWAVCFLFLLSLLYTSLISLETLLDFFCTKSY